MTTWKIAYDPKDVVPELEHRVVVLAPSNRLKRRPKIRDAQDVADLLDGASALDREAFWVLPIDAKNALIGVYVAHLGGTSVTVVEPAVVVRLLLATQAAKTIVVHNHPSGYNAPSEEDVALTRRLTTALGFFDIGLVDHVILAKDDAFFSFQKAGML